MIDVVCVKMGPKYGPEYVNNLYAAVRRHTTLPFRFVCVTDDPTGLDDVVVVSPPTDFPADANNPLKAWWYKIWLFSPACPLANEVLYFDLDMVIVGNIDKFFDYAGDRLGILHDFNRQFNPKIDLNNSSIMRWRRSEFWDIWHGFALGPQEVIRKHRGDQDWITACLHNSGNTRRAWWPRNWAMSWKWELLHGGKKNNGTGRTSYHQPDKPYVIPPELAVIVCHGVPKPDEITLDIIQKDWCND